MNKTVGSDISQAGRLLSDNELDAVNGGITGGCIRYPTILEPFLPPPSPGFVDQFASRLPSWVRPL
jgi:hypothetical protein